MTRLPDTTDDAPTRRMAVVRAEIEAEGWAPLLPQAQAAAILAAKRAHETMPAVPMVALTDAFLDADEKGITFTVQAWARTPLDHHAHAGLGAAVATILATCPGEARLRTIQSVGLT